MQAAHPEPRSGLGSDPVGTATPAECTASVTFSPFQTMQHERQEMNEALKAAKALGGSAHKTMTTNAGKWPTVTQAKLQVNIQQCKHNADDQPWALPLQDKRWLLSFDEEACYANWLREKSEAHEPQSRANQTSKILEILELRVANNRQGGRKFLKLSKSGLKALNNKEISPKFFGPFFKRHAGFLSQKIPRDEDIRRAKAAHPEIVDIHFSGKYGLTATFKAAGVMNDDGVIDDLRRVLNMDESELRQHAASLHLPLPCP
jgi:hypothetical protein